MPIELSDIPTAVAAYLDEHVTTVVDNVSSGGTIEHGEVGTFDVTVTNAAAPDGVRLINVRYHLTISPASVAKFVADSSVLAPQRATNDPDDPVLANGALTDVMFIFPMAGINTSAELEVGETIKFTKKVKGLTAGTPTIKCHVHAEIDENSVFPKGESSPFREVQFSVT